MEEKSAFVEHIVKRGNDAEIVLRKMLVVCLTLLIPSIFLFFPFLEQFAFLALLVCAAIGTYFFMLQNVEYEFAVTSGQLDVDMICGKRKRKHMVTVDGKDIELMAPMKRAYMGDFNSSSIQKRYFAASSPKSRTRWFALFNNEKGQKSVLIFEPTPEMQTALRFAVGPRNFKAE